MDSYYKSFRIGMIAAIAALSQSVSAQEDDPVRRAQDTLTEWVSVEKQISKDKGDWIAQKEVLSSSIEFMKGEISRLDEEIETARKTASAGEKKRAELNEKKESLDAVTAEVKKAVEGYETTILALSKSWPSAFLESVDVFMKRIPTKELADKVQLTVRLQNVVAILTQFDKFQGIITKVTAVQDVGGVSREVTTLYYGFAYAYFVDAAGEYAGYGYPTEEGWKWEADASLAADALELVTVFDRGVDAHFIGMPAKIVTP